MMRKKILMVGPDRGVHGGISAVVNEFYKAGLDDKVELKYISTMREGSKVKKALIAGRAYLDFLTKLGWCDIVHVHFSSDSSFVRKSFFIKTAYKHGKKIVLHQHGGDFINYYENQLSDRQRRNVKDILSMGNRMLVLTSFWKDFFSTIIDGEKIEVFPNGIVTNDSNRVAYAMDGNTNALLADKDFAKILFLGRICREKGLDELLEAMDGIHVMIPEAKLYIGGIYEDESYKEEFGKRSDYITYLGWLDEKGKDMYLKKCGILVLPSYFEGFGMTIIEAMLREDAVIGSNVGGIPDIIENRENGILIPAKDSFALKNALLELINDKEKAKEYGKKGKEKVKKYYSVEKNIEKLLDVYERCMSD